MTEYASARQIWDSIQELRVSFPNQIEDIERRHRELFCTGQVNVREIVEQWVADSEIKIFMLEKYPTCFEDMHPNVFSLLVKYGRPYTPVRWLMSPEEFLGGLFDKQCGRNASFFMNRSISPLVYVEGVVVGAMSYPLLHAWNSKSIMDSVAYDVSEYPVSHWCTYFGIPFRTEELAQAGELITGQRRGRSMLFKKENFPKVESYLEYILAKRAEESKTAA